MELILSCAFERVVPLRDNPAIEVTAREASDAIERALPAGIALEPVAKRVTPSCGRAISRSPQ